MVLLPPGVNPIAVDKYNISYDISYHIISYHIISYHIISYHIISYHIISYHISYIIYHISHIIYHISHIISYIISHHITSYHIICHISYHIISYHIIYHISYHITSTEICNNNMNVRCDITASILICSNILRKEIVLEHENDGCDIKVIYFFKKNSLM